MAASVMAVTFRPGERPSSGGMAAAAVVRMMSTTANEQQGGTVDVLEHRYELGALLGAGSMGEVYAAHDTVLGIEVAVKMMYARDVASHDRVARFTYEASIGARMMSPHITKVLGLAVTSAGIPCIVYELLEGETLACRLEREGTLSVELTAEIVKQTARALARVHGVGVVHRDVKPDNIFLTRDLEGRLLVKLLDFGIAEQMSGEAAQLIGTPAYMPPEVVFGTAALDPRADLYALGVVAFECLTGTTPFRGAVHEIFAALRTGQRPSLRQALPTATRELDAWADRALHSDPFWRFASTKEMLEGLDHALTSKRAAKLSECRAA